jgi:hypothetical protein
VLDAELSFAGEDLRLVRSWTSALQLAGSTIIPTMDHLEQRQNEDGSRVSSRWRITDKDNLKGDSWLCGQSSRE